MGAEQSSQRSSAPAEATPQKTCYYELLSVERTATDDELKKAYRRKALELHPDRNISDVANATRKFAEVQTAYEILSDPQERAWYDSHRDDILRGDSGAAGGDEEGGGAGPRYYNNVRLTPAEDLYQLMGRFSTSVPFDDSPYGFFGILEATFAQLALEEEAAFSWDTTRNSQELPFYHPFGSAGEDYDAVAKPFYKDWSNFVTTKSFSWKDKYRLSDAPDRQVRRMMEKENKKSREQGIREFNDAVRSLVAFVRKRDPRYIPNTQSEAERQQVLRDSANAQAQRQRAANQERRRQQQEQAGYVEPGYRAEEKLEDVSSSEEEEEEKDEVVEEIECVVCDKTFKSEKQFEAHEKSRKHVKAVQTLKWQMRKENKAFNLDEHELLPPRESNEAGGKKGKKNKKAKKEEADEDEDAEVEDEEEEDGHETKAKATDDEESESNDEYAPRHVVESRFKVVDEEEEEEEEEDSDNEFAARMKKLSLKKQKKKKKQMKQMGLFDDEKAEEEEEEEEEEKPEAEQKVSKEEKVEEKKETEEKEDSEPNAKMGKAKARREKRAAIQAAAAAAAGENEGVVACTMCRKTFSSNTKLHQHLRTDHTAAPKGKGKKKR
ncbi:c2h2 finger domain containing protein [Ophiostoma piceae UAMH 11346]|uniref:C2h2 finger domain containing protein n=1 Tax=Ophiostoma piceae (strain UAMH 11346) TaxID=1262450 RepID=S3BQN8_OPHP1|nr:c2h2 finger domain containing protein [Ophiostoma piceae UAMH 11346]